MELQPKNPVLALTALAVGVALGAAAPAVGGPSETLQRPEIQVVELERYGVTCFQVDVEWDPSYNGSRAGLSCLPTEELGSGG